MREPLILPAAALTAGILAARAVPLDLPPLEAGISLLVLLSMASFALGRGKVGTLSLLAAALLAGAWTATFHSAAAPPRLDAGAREMALFSGCVVMPPAFSADREQLVLELAPRARARVNVYPRDGAPPPRLNYGQRIEFAGHGQPVRNFRNAGSFDYVAYLARSDIYWTISARTDTIRVLPGHCGSPFWDGIFGLRAAALNRLERLYAGDPYTTAMMQAVLIGDSAKLEKVWTQDFRRTGTYHVLVISGLHVSVLAGCLLFLLRMASVAEFPSLLVTALAAWLYALVSGFTAPVVRAAGGFTFFLCARFFFRRTRVLNLVAAISLVYLFLDPAQLADGSFQLSFLAVIAIGALAVPLFSRTIGRYAGSLCALWERDRDVHLEPRAAQLRVELRLLGEALAPWIRLPPRIVTNFIGLVLRGAFFVFELIVLSAVVQVGLALPMTAYFHRLSFSGLSANVVIVPLMTCAIPVGFAAIFTGWHAVAALGGLLLDLSRRVAGFHARWEPNWRVPDPPAWLGITFIAALVVLAILARRSAPWWKPAAAVAAGLFAVIVVHPFPPRIVSGSLELTAVDVGQGEALFVALPAGNTMMVDGGGIPANGRNRKPALDIGEDVVAPYLWSRSVRRLDVLVSTHGHEDHAGGLPALVAAFHPRELWTGATPGSIAWDALRAQALAAGMRIRPLRADEAFLFGGAGFRVLSPPPNYRAGMAPANNDSLVMTISYGRHRFLLTGDAEWPMESEMLGRGLPRADVLKIAHHGSRTSSSEPFLAAVHPAFALISAGRDNQFGLPHRDVLGRLGDLAVELYRTDLDGRVTIRTDGWKITTTTDRLEGH
ncbi:MAG: ComEC/Rec2 family competence protein [Bryobacterales bacterium]|nr:ComEC/Rec2 family competence protein [Bryobacterales bacterium]